MAGVGQAVVFGWRCSGGGEVLLVVVGNVGFARVDLNWRDLLGGWECFKLLRKTKSALQKIRFC